MRPERPIPYYFWLLCHQGSPLGHQNTHALDLLYQHARSGAPALTSVHAITIPKLLQMQSPWCECQPSLAARTCTRALPPGLYTLHLL